MEIRHSTFDDFEQITAIYDYAREFMRRNGNATQWGPTHPSVERIRRDISDGVGYVITENGVIAAVFAFIIGPDPTYAQIREGRWLNDKPYGAIHRIASDGRTKGVFDAMLAFCEEQIADLRVDTHRDNAPMLHLLASRGFTKCGLITTDDGTERIAFQKSREE